MKFCDDRVHAYGGFKNVGFLQEQTRIKSILLH